MSWPGDWQTNVLFLLRWAHLLAATAWLGLVVFADRVYEKFRAGVGAEARLAARRSLEPRTLFWQRWAALATVATGFADYVLVLASEGIAGRALVFLCAWTFASIAVVWSIGLSASGRALKDGRALAAALAMFLAAVAASGDLYMRRGGSHKAVALSLGGGLALVMFSNVWFLLAPASRRLLLALPQEPPELERRVFLANRVNLWLSVAVLFLMAAASHLPLFETVAP